LTISKKTKSILWDWGIPFGVLAIIVIFGIPCIKFFTVMLVKLYYDQILHPDKFDTTTTGAIGDTFGGTTGPIFALVASYLTFIAFWVQYRANEQQKYDLKIERFENKFYELIGLHRNNVNEIIIGKSIAGRKAFRTMFHELKYIYLCTSDYYRLEFHKHSDQKLSDEQLYNIAYIIFFFGIGENSSKIVLDLVGENNTIFFTGLENSFKDNQIKWKDERKKGQTVCVAEGDKIFTLDIPYKPMNGHMSRLSHYIRHIFQIVRFVDEGYPEDDYEAKYAYITTLRAQLSNYEQLLIYYNALSVMGAPWRDINKGQTEFLLKKYCVVKSLPLTLADFYRTPVDLFGSNAVNDHGKPLFEWTEIKKRIQHLS
jgi:hypothetical protein